MDVNTKVIVSPAKWIVAPKGTTKSFTSSLTSFFSTHCNVTGIVAAEDWVPTAVKYAGNIFFINLIGFCFLTLPAILYWIII